MIPRNQNYMKNKKVIVSVIVCLVIAIISFFVGIKYGEGKTPASSQSQTFNRMQQGNKNGGSGMRGGLGGGIVSGEILSKDATSMIVKLRDGGSKIVLTSPSIKVEKTVDGLSADLIVGKSVMVTGTANPDGSVSATSIQIRPNFVMPTKIN